MKIIKKTTGLLIAAVFLFMLTPVNVFAANTILSISKSDIKAGDDFTVTVSGAETSNLSLHYDGTMVTLKSQGNATLNGNILSINARSASFAFTAKKSGSAGFVASSDKYARSSVRINIGEADAADTTTADTNAATDDTKAAADTSSDNTSDKTQTKDAATDNSSKSTDSTAASDATAASDGTVSDSTSTAADVKDYPEISTSDFSLKELVLDRRITLIIGALLAVIIVLVIMLVWSHLSSLKDYDEEDEEPDDIADDFDDEKINIKEQVKAPSEKKPDFSDDEDETDKLYERLKEEEKLSMPKTPVVPEKKLHLEDLNNL